MRDDTGLSLSSQSTKQVYSASPPSPNFLSSFHLNMVTVCLCLMYNAHINNYIDYSHRNPVDCRK